MKKKWNLIIATPVLATSLLVGLVGCSSESVETPDEVKTEVVAKEMNGFDEVVYYTNEIEVLFEKITSEYDSIWDEYWKPSWQNINTIEREDLQSNMESIEEKYSDLNRLLIDFKVDESSKYQEEYNAFRENISKSISYRGNAGTAIVHATKGLATLEDRMKESKRSVELADEYLLKGLSSIVTVKQDLGLTEE